MVFVVPGVISASIPFIVSGGADIARVGVFTKSDLFAHGFWVFANFTPDIFGDGAGCSRGLHQGPDVVTELVIAEGGVIGICFLSEGGNGGEDQSGEKDGSAVVHGRSGRV